MRLAASLARDRATIVAIGDVGLDLDRQPLYEKELVIKVSRAYGPGRYDPVYEDLAIDYPIGFVRWTIGRNLDAIMSLIASQRLNVKDLTTHRFSFDRAIEAYDVFDSADPYLGILLEYEPASVPKASRIRLDRAGRNDDSATDLASGLIGAGRFAAGVLLPAAKRAGFGPWTCITSEGGASAVRVGEDHAFDAAVSTVDEVVNDDNTNVVFIASRHDTHAEMVVEALTAGKHVFCEKPLALTESELSRVEEAWGNGSATLMVGFNRRWSPAIKETARFFGDSSPRQIVYRVHAGQLPPDHWLNDRRQGGRLLGEACHFIDTCNTIAGESPRRVYAIASGDGELLLQEDFTITLDYPSGSQAVLVYSAGAPRGAGKERIEIISGDRSAIVDDFRTVTMRTATKTGTVKYKPADKGHSDELVAFREAIEGKRDGLELCQSAIDTSRIALAAVESLMTGRSVSS